MAGSLVLLDSETVSSAVSTVDLGGANWDTSYDVYRVVVSKLLLRQNQKGYFLDN